MKRKMYKRISYEDRKRIEEMNTAGVDMTRIAAEIGVHYQTIARELKRGGNPYSANTAQKSIGKAG